MSKRCSYQTRQFPTRRNHFRREKNPFIPHRREPPLQGSACPPFSYRFSLKRHFSGIPWATVQGFPWMQPLIEIQSPAGFARRQRGFSTAPGRERPQPTPSASTPSINSKLMGRNLKAGIESSIFSACYLHCCDTEKRTLQVNLVISTPSGRVGRDLKHCQVPTPCHGQGHHGVWV